MQITDPVIEFQKAMSLFAAGVTVITTMSDGKPAGLVATSVCSLSSTPPSIVVCVNKSAATHDVLIQEGKFAVNLLSVEHRGVVDRFRDVRGEARFDTHPWRVSKTGSPMLDDAVVVLDCEIAGRHDGFSHSIFIGVIRDIAFARQDDAPACLMWHGRTFARCSPLSA
ncbi:flavin reductase family protein [Caballeronia sp. LZ034LL]|uniref:flavin reductase family protein n=1 Tax=Caballeronia sp. LZ034LL TaxID=3038567 RepID=UPI0028666F54|nr:flavin reductase family protein [Caballeronia sp. LZ034LL]MDR5836361.1 flavin reductase family protein [Caballeronia sp. LZ034LL]